jgi:hypothetical protein
VLDGRPARRRGLPRRGGICARRAPSEEGFVLDEEGFVLDGRPARRDLF